ncbi:MAG: hypothetical protein LBG16_05650 [Elusimicrobiota bacterium]|jgi:formate hydrogenlyase subunit 3/multisubunit Na+/H+ antiporter MnhD subunit|nr:hypothetical protein [Elusimicrobiota bacterium]
MTIYFPAAFPLACALLAAALGKFMPRAAKFLAFAGTSLAFIGLITLNNFSNIINNAPDTAALTIACFIALYGILASLWAAQEEESPLFYFNILLSTAFAVGAVITDNLLAMLFFWEGLLITLYLFLMPYNKDTALKAFLINAAGDIVLLAGICLFYANSHSLLYVSLIGDNFWAFALIFCGAAAKAGAFPFHSWIAPAAKDAPFAFLAMMPAAFEKLLAIFLLGRIFIVLFPVPPDMARVFACIIGAITVIVSAARMLVFKDLRGLLAWAVVMQIGLFITALGARLITETDISYILNHGIFKAALLACAFFTAGALNKACGGNDIAALRGAAKTDILLFAALLICALGLAGVSIVDIIFIPNAALIDCYDAMPMLAAVPAAAALSALFAFGKVLLAMLHKTHKIARPAGLQKAIALAAFAPVLFFTFGLEFSAEHLFLPHFSGVHTGAVSVICIVLLLAGLLLAAKVKQPVYEFKYDTYDRAKAAISFCADILFMVDRVMDKLFDYLPSQVVKNLARGLSQAHRGNTPQYIIWAVAGIAVFIILAWGGLK